MRTPPLADTMYSNVSLRLWAPLAKKLKQSWVEAQKIKSQWKAQKRKEGIATKSGRFEELVADHQENAVASGPSHGAENEEAEETPHAWRGSASSTAAEESSEDESVADRVDDASIRRTAPTRSKRQQQMRPDVAVADPPSLRDLQRQAYSKSSLHTFKSGHRGSGATSGAHATAPMGGRGRGGAVDSQRGRGHVRGRGRGQPDMRLRMNAMLEKIKRDYT